MNQRQELTIKVIEGIRLKQEKDGHVGHGLKNMTLLLHG